MSHDKQVFVFIVTKKYLNVTKWRCGIVAFDTFSNACCQPSLSILPSSIVPYDRISLSDQYRIICAYEDGSDRNAICEENPSVDENNVKAVIRRYLLFWIQRLLSEAIRLTEIQSLVHDCFAFYSMQFMQIRRTPCQLFTTTT